MSPPRSRRATDDDSRKRGRMGVVPLLVVVGAVVLIACSELTGLPDLSYQGEGRYLTPLHRGEEHVPVVSGDRVVWQGGETGDLKVYDFREDTVRTLVRSPASILDHDLEGGRLVWTVALDTSAQARAGPTRLELMNLRDGTRRTLKDDSVRMIRPSIWGSRLAWEDYRHGNAEIYVMDLDSGETTRVTNSPAHDHDPVVWRHVIAWIRGQSGPVYLLDLQSGDQHAISGSAATGSPALRDGHLVWEDRRGPSWDVYHFDIDTGEQQRLGSPTDVDQVGSNQRDPSVAGNTVVWKDTRWGPDDIYLYDLTADTERLIDTGLGSYRAEPDLSDGTVVWVGDDRLGDYGLYGLELR